MSKREQALVRKETIEVDEMEKKISDIKRRDMRLYMVIIKLLNII
jgi:hypothetical protein